MSVRVMTKVFDAILPEVELEDKRAIKRTITPSTMKLTLLALADHASGTGESVYPSLETISRKTGLSVRSIQRATDALGKLNIVSVVGWSKVGTLSYRLNVDELSKFAHDPGSPLNMTLGHPKHDPGSSNPSVNHQFKLNDKEEEIQPVNIFTLYESEIGAITPLIADKLMLAEKEYPSDWISKAFKIASGNNARNWNYIETCLKNMQTKGVDWKPGGNGNGKKSTPTEPGLFPVLREWINEDDK